MTIVAVLFGWLAIAAIEHQLRTTAGLPLILFGTGFAGILLHRSQRTGASLAALALGCLVVTAMDPGTGTLVQQVAALVGAGALAYSLRWLAPTLQVAGDPIVVALAAAITAVPAAFAGAALAPGEAPSTAASIWGATTLGSILWCYVAISFRPDKTSWLGLGLLIGLAAVLPQVVLGSGSTPATVGFLAWLALPVLLVIGWRYGTFATSVIVAVLAVATGLARSRIDLAESPAVVVQMQLSAMVLAVVVVTSVVLIREQRRTVARLRADREVRKAFLSHADAIWYVKTYESGAPRYRLLGGGPFRGREAVTEVRDEQLYGSAGAEVTERGDREVVSTGVATVATETLTTPDGVTRTYLCNRFPLRDDNGRVTAVGGLRTDVTDREEQGRVAADRGRLLADMFASSPVPAMRVVRDGELWVAAGNPALGRILGRRADGLSGAKLREIIDERDWAAVVRLFERDGNGPRGWYPQAEVRVPTRVGPPRVVVMTVAPLQVDRTDGMAGAAYIVNMEDVTARRAAEEAVARHSLYDSQTGLLNRVALGDRIDAALHRVAESSGGVALIVLDVDEFKSVNDTFGHAIGDSTLVELGRRMRAECDSDVGVARLSADEFAIVLEWTVAEEAGLLAGRLQSRLSAPIAVGDHEFSVSVSFGVALTGDEGVTASELVRRAELALFLAKRAGLGRVEFYADSMRAQVQAVLNVRTELTRAIASDALAVHYQPIVGLDDGRTVDFEALVRLNTSDGRVLAPSEFLDIARSAEMIRTLDAQVARRALHDLTSGALPAATAGISVNCEPEDLRDPDFAMTILDQVLATSCDPTRLTVEVTEVALLWLDETVRANVASLREAGVQVAIDDFGTGYSSLAQLRDLDADIIKIDRTFVDRMPEDPETVRIVATLIGLAHELGLTTIAEGIETREQAEALRRLGCDRGQGFLFGRPQPVADPLRQEPMPHPQPGTASR